MGNTGSTQETLLVYNAPTGPNQYVVVQFFWPCGQRTPIAGTALISTTDINRLSDLTIINRYQLCPSAVVSNGTTSMMSSVNLAPNLTITWNGVVDSSGVTVSYNNRSLSPISITQASNPCGSQGIFTQGYGPCPTSVSSTRQVTASPAYWWLLLIILIIAIIVVIYFLFFAKR